MSRLLDLGEDVAVQLREQSGPATARMRRAFRYPAEDSDEDVVDGLDEEEQESMIKTLAARDESSTKLYQAVFLLLPCLTSLVYTPSLVVPASFGSFFRSLVAITSLLSTAYILWFLPLAAPQENQIRGSRFGNTSAEIASPLQQYIMYLNGGLNAMLLFGAYGSWNKGEEEETWLALIPGLIFLLILFVRTQLRPVDLDELKRLRYDYKGA